MVPQKLRTQNTELVAVAQTLQEAFFSFSFLRTDEESARKPVTSSSKE